MARYRGLVLLLTLSSGLFPTASMADERVRGRVLQRVTIRLETTIPDDQPIKCRGHIWNYYSGIRNETTRIVNASRDGRTATCLISLQFDWVVYRPDYGVDGEVTVYTYARGDVEFDGLRSGIEARVENRNAIDFPPDGATIEMPLNARL